MVALICGWIGSADGVLLSEQAKQFALSMVAEPDRRDEAVVCHTAVGRAVLAAVYLPPRNSSYAEEKLPLFENERIALVADARLYNRSDLSKSIRIGIDEVSDAQVIARLYEMKGEKGLDLLKGDFAFALYDKLDACLILRRDHFGVRPLYYSETQKHGFAFASLARGLTSSGIVEEKRDWESSMQMLGGFTNINGRTLVKGLRRFPPASQYSFKDGQLSKSRYWRLQKPKAPSTESFEDWCAGMKTRFDGAIARRLPKNGPVASEISAGLDAGGVTASAANLLLDDDQHIHAYCASSKENPDADVLIDETGPSRQIAQASNRVSFIEIPHRITQPGKRMQPEPDRLEGAGWYREDETCRQAAELGADTILCGWGGDEAVTYRESLARLNPSDPSTAKRTGLRGFASTIARRTLPGSVIDTLDKRFGSRAYTAKSLSGFKRRYRADVAGDIRTQDIAQSQIDGLERLSLSGRLEAMAATSAAHGMQYLVPMLDIDLVTYMLTAPRDYLNSKDMNRRAFRSIMEGVLPDECRLRDQKMLPAPEVPLEVARNKQDYLERLAALETDKRLHEYVDFKFLRKQLNKLPNYVEARANYEEAFAKGKQAMRRSGNGSFIAVSTIETLQQWLNEEPNET